MRNIRITRETVVAEARSTRWLGNVISGLGGFYMIAGLITGLILAVYNAAGDSDNCGFDASDPCPPAVHPYVSLGVGMIAIAIVGGLLLRGFGAYVRMRAMQVILELEPASQTS